MTNASSGPRARGTAAAASAAASSAASSVPAPIKAHEVDDHDHDDGASKPHQHHHHHGGKPARIYKPNPALDAVLTTFFVGTLVFMVYINLWRGDEVSLFQHVGWTVFAAVAAWFTRVVAVRVGRFLSERLAHTPLAKQVNMDKFLEQSWQLVVHLVFSAWEAYMLYHYDWWNSVDALWLPLGDAYTPPACLRMFYSAQIGAWTYTAIVHRWFDKRRKDYFVMFTHHIMTVFLVVASGAFNFHRVGMIILVIHDMSDIGVDLLKLVNYLNLTGTKYLFASEVTFVANLIMWVYFRLYLFPTHVLNFTLVEGHKYGTDTYPGQPWFNPFPERITPYFPCAIMLLALQVLHIWWTFLFIRIAYKLTVKGAHQAGREEYEGDSDVE